VQYTCCASRVVGCRGFAAWPRCETGIGDPPPTAAMFYVA
jgi:hypothetical protein